MQDAAQEIIAGSRGVLQQIWGISRRAWNKLMHSITGNTTRTAKNKKNMDKINKEMNSQQKIEEDVLLRGFNKLLKSSFKDWTIILDLKGKNPDEIVQMMRIHLRNVHRSLPQRLRSMFGDNRIKAAATKAVSDLYKVQNGRWICRACGRFECTFDPVLS